MSEFWKGFWLGFTGPIHLLSLRKIRKGEEWRINNVPIGVREDFTRWNSIRFRWLWWWNSIPAYRVSPPQEK